MGKFADKLKDLIEKLEGAETLEAAKELVPELKQLIPEDTEAVVEEGSKSEEADIAEEAKEDKKEEEVKEEEKVEEKSEAEKKLEEVAEEAAKEDEKPAEEVVEKPAEEAPAEEKPAEEEEVEKKPAALSDALDLNDKLIAKMKFAIDINEKLKQENNSYKTQVEELQTKVAKFQENEDSRNQARFEAQFDQVFNKYVTHFSVEDADVDGVKTSMAKFSEAELANIETYIDKKELAAMCVMVCSGRIPPYRHIGNTLPSSAVRDRI